MTSYFHDSRILHYARHTEMIHVSGTGLEIRAVPRRVLWNEHKGKSRQAQIIPEDYVRTNFPNADYLDVEL